MLWKDTGVMAFKGEYLVICITITNVFKRFLIFQSLGSF